MHAYATYATFPHAPYMSISVTNVKKESSAHGRGMLSCSGPGPAVLESCSCLSLWRHLLSNHQASRSQPFSWQNNAVLSLCM